ncbi:MAG TPA: GNAT family N-acetyltransferase [Herpetosiphonaceae bacterium]
MSNHASDSTTGSVVLRDVSEDDLPIFFEQQLDPEACAMAAFPSREWDAFIAHWRKILANDTLIKQTILFAGAVAGNIGAFEQDGQTQIGYWLGRSYWGKGVASAALAAFVDHVKTRPLYAHVVKHNRASMRVLEKSGFTICGQETGEDGVEEWTLKLDTSPNSQA